MQQLKDIFSTVLSSEYSDKIIPRKVGAEGINKYWYRIENYYDYETIVVTD